MRGLFVRIFLSFCAAMTIAVAGSMLVYVTDSRADFRRQSREFLADTLRVRGDLLLERIAHGEARAIEGELQALARRSRVKVFVWPDGHSRVGAGAPRPRMATLVLRARESQGFVHERDEEHRVASFVVPLRGGLVGAELPIPARHELWGQTEALPARLTILFLAIGLVAYWLARYLTRPITALRSAAQRIADGDLTVRVEPNVRGATDEIAALGRDFDRMAEQIATLLEGKERLLRDVSHELRSPLARLTLALGLARKRVGEGPQPELDRIEREAERLGELIGHILTLARLAEIGPLPEGPIDLVGMLGSVLHDAEFEAGSKGCGVTLHAPEPVELVAHAESLRWAIENVIRNAIAYTAPGTTVDVRVETEGPSVRIEIRDHGSGVPEDALEAIFRPFYRVGTDRDRKTGGTGVGLAITDRVIGRHDGRVSASNAEGGGLRVVLELPRRGRPREGT